MELILKSNNEESLAKIIALAKKLNVILEKKDIDFNNSAKIILKTVFLILKLQHLLLLAMRLNGNNINALTVNCLFHRYNITYLNLRITIKTSIVLPSLLNKPD